MHIIQAIPISRGISKEVLSYFAPSDVPLGAMVKVPLRNKTVAAIVVGKESVTDAKAAIRSSPFQIKKIDKLSPVTLVSPALIESAHETARYVASSTGAVLSHLIPSAITEFAEKIAPQKKGATEPIKKKAHEVLVFQTEDEERLARYKSVIREEFARKCSVVFCLPTIQDIRKIVSTLPKGIEEYTYVFHGALPKKELLSTWNAISGIDHPILVIGTPIALSLPRTDIGTIIIERENSSAYKGQTRPYLDTRTFAEVYAKKSGARLIFGDLLLRSETIARYENAELHELAPLKFRSLTPATQLLVDMRAYKTAGTEKIEFRIFSDELEALIRGLRESNENLFLFGARRGLSPTTVCGDCSNIVSCSNCSAPIILHSHPKGNFFLCHKCGERRSAEERCKVCGSWKLVTLGIGIERIEATLKEIFPDVTIFTIDKDTVKTLKQGIAIAEKFYATPGSILLGTEMALLYLDRKVENAAVVSMDSLFSIPDYRIGEKIVSILLRMRAVCEKQFILQTRNADQDIFKDALQGNLMDFYRREISERKQFEYPPFSTFIKITMKGDRAEVTAEMKKLESYFSPYPINIFPAFTEILRGQYVMHALLKIPKREWVNPDLLEKLRLLPPKYAVNVDPESLL